MPRRNAAHPQALAHHKFALSVMQNVLLVTARHMKLTLRDTILLRGRLGQVGSRRGALTHSFTHSLASFTSLIDPLANRVQACLASAACWGISVTIDDGLCIHCN